MAIPSAPLLDKKQAANYLNIKEKTLDVWNCTKRYNLKYIKVGRLIRYRQEDLDQFLTERTISQKEESAL